MHIEERLNEGSRIQLKQENENEAKQNKEKTYNPRESLQVDEEDLAWDTYRLIDVRST